MARLIRMIFDTQFEVSDGRAAGQLFISGHGKDHNARVYPPHMLQWTRLHSTAVICVLQLAKFLFTFSAFI